MKGKDDKVQMASLVVLGGGGATDVSESTLALTPQQTETALRLKEVSDSFIVTTQAKESIAASQLSQFYELLCAKLRIRLAELDARSRDFGTSSDTSKDATALVSTLSSAFGTPQIGPAALAMIVLSQSGFMNGLGIKATLVLAMTSLLKRKVELLTEDMQREKYRNIVQQFMMNHSSKDGLETERSVRDVASAIALRHVHQVVPLTKESQTVLADIIVSRICRHLGRSRFGFENESRSPVIASFQRHERAMRSVYNRFFLPQDRVYEPQPLSLLQRCIRALTYEKSTDDDVQLQLEPWFTSSRSSSISKQEWTASGVLSKTGLRVRSQQQREKTDLFYVHEVTQHWVYGFAYGDEFERKERRMHLLDHSKL